MSDWLAALPGACVPIDGANIPGNPDHGPLAVQAIHVVLGATDHGTEKAVHFYLGHYGGQAIESGNWSGGSGS